MIIRAKLYDQKRVYRDICASPDNTLYELAEFVITAFKFDLDHCFGFFSSPDIYGKGRDSVHYELFYDISEEVEELTESVEKTAVKQLFSSQKDKWWMLFDYGDDWVFELECVAIDESGKPGKVLKVSGEAPQQYGGEW